MAGVNSVYSSIICEKSYLEESQPCWCGGVVVLYLFEERMGWGGEDQAKNVENMPTVADVVRDSLGGSVWYLPIVDIGVYR